MCSSSAQGVEPSDGPCFFDSEKARRASFCPFRRDRVERHGERVGNSSLSGRRHRVLKCRGYLGAWRYEIKLAW